MSKIHFLILRRIFFFYFFHQLFEPILPKYMVSISKSVNIVSDRRIRLGQASAALENSAQWFSRSPLRWRRSRTLLVWLCFVRFLRMVDRLRLKTFSNNNLKQGHWNDAKWANISHFHDGKFFFTLHVSRLAFPCATPNARYRFLTVICNLIYRQ